MFLKIILDTTCSSLSLCFRVQKEQKLAKIRFAKKYLEWVYFRMVLPIPGGAYSVDEVHIH